MTHFTVLGSIGVRNGDEPVAIGGPRQRRLLGALLLDAGSAVSTDRLVEAVWSDGQLPDAPLDTLRTHVARLRRSLDAVGLNGLVTVDGGYRLDGPVDLDAARFEELFDAARRRSADGDHAAALVALDEALGLWTGRPYGDLGDDYAMVEANRLESLRIDAEEARLESRLELGTRAELVPDIERFIAAHPLRERPRRLLMLALFREGRQADAVRAYQDFRRVLVEETGLEPSRELAELERRMVSGDPTLSARHRTLRGYELGEKIGEGAFGEIYVARQPTVDRDVAVKVVHPTLADDPEFIQRFEAEAQLIARLEHPHIVPLYDFWREPGGAYLVMRYLRGGSAQQRLDASGPFSLAQVTRLVAEIGSALAAAHGRGVVHRDVKPSNVLFDEDGNSYLADFGIAVESATRRSVPGLAAAGSPLYASPEQLRDGRSTQASDLYSFGVTVWELLAGETPFLVASDSVDSLVQHKLRTPPPPITERRPDLPDAAAEAIRRATTVSPDDRFASVEEFVIQFRQAATGAGPSIDDAAHTARPPHDGTPPEAGSRPLVGRSDQPARGGDTLVTAATGRPNPYKGLRAFDEADAADFHGREALVTRLLDHLDESPFLAVVGPSGSGKSSAVRAGVVPTLRAADAFVITMVPGRHPYDELETALLRIAPADLSSLMQQLRDDERGLSRAVRRVLPRPDDELVLVIDQFEELFTLADESVRDEFLASLIAAVDSDRRAIRVVVTVRADFYDRPLALPGIGELVRDNTVAVTPLSTSELEEAITAPAASVGVTVEPAVVGELVAEVHHSPGSLPLLQYALTELYERRADGRMTTEAYEEIGGLTGALASRADGLYEDLDPAGREAARRLFLRLITPGEGVEDTRRRVRRSELPGVPASFVDAFGAARLLSFDRDPATREPTVEVAHEALIREWPRLRAWVDEDRDGLRAQRHLTATAESWAAGGRDPGELYRGGRLEAALEMAGSGRAELTDLEQEFLDASVAARDADLEAERRQVRRLRRAVVVIGAVLVVALSAGALAVQQRQRADEQADEATDARAAAETRRLVSDAPQLVDTNRRVGLLLAAEAYRRDPSPQTLGALQRVLTSTGNFLGYLRTGEEFLDVEWLSDDRLALLTPTGVEVVDVESGATTLTLAVSSPLTLEVNGDGSRLAVTTAAQTAVVFETSTGAPIGDERRHTAPVATATFMPDDTLVTGTRTGAIVLWPPDGGPPRLTIAAHPEEGLSDLAHLGQDADLQRPHEPDTFLVGVVDVAASPDGRQLASLGTGYLRVWDSSRGELVMEQPFTRGVGDDRVLTAPAAVAFGTTAPDEIHAASPFHRQVWRDGELTHEQAFDQNDVFQSNTMLTTYVTNGDVGVLAVDDGRAIVSDLTGGKPDLSLDTGLSGMQFAAPDPSGRRLAVGAADGLALFSLEAQGLISRAAPRDDRALAFVSNAGDRVVLSAEQSGPRLVDIGGERRTVDLDGDHAYISHDQYLVFRSDDQMLARIDPDTLDTLTTYGPTTSWLIKAVPDHGWLLVGAGGPADDLVVRVYDLDSGEEVAVLDGLQPLSGRSAFVRNLGVDPDGRRVVATTSEGSAIVWDTSTWEQVEPTLSAGGGAVLGAQFSPDGRYLATVGADGAIQLRHPETFQPLHRLLGNADGSEGISEGPFFSPDGRYMVTAADGRPRLWDLERLEQIGGVFPNDRGAAPNASSDARYLVTLVGDQAIVWDLDVDAWPEIACRAAGRNLTLEEWEQFGPTDSEYVATCPQWPSALDTEE